MTASSNNSQNLRELADDLRWRLVQLREDARWFIPDIKEKIGQWWYWDTDLEALLIKLRLRREFDFDRCYELIGGNTDDFVDSSNFAQPCEVELSEFIDCLDCCDVSDWSIERTPTTTIEIAEAFFENQEHESWMRRAMDPTCWDY